MDKGGNNEEVISTDIYLYILARIGSVRAERRRRFWWFDGWVLWHGWYVRRFDRRHLRWRNRHIDRYRFDTYGRCDWWDHGDQRFDNGYRQLDRYLDGWRDGRCDGYVHGRFDRDQRFDRFVWHGRYNGWRDQYVDGDDRFILFYGKRRCDRRCE
jgi:hypothetical protein